MKLLSIEARNFLSHAASRVDFNGDRLSTFSGPNGAGKSALLEALLYTLYDAARGRTDDLVRLGSSDMAATVRFEFGGSTYRVSRGRSTRAGGKSFLELHVLDETPDVMDWRPLTRESIRETQALIAELLRLDADTFATAAFLRQGEADRFISATAGDRKRILATVLGLDRYERARDRAAEQARDVDAAAAADAQQLAHLDMRLGEYHGWMAQRIDAGELDPEQLRGRTLACWCSPAPCHGSVILDWLEDHPLLPIDGERVEFGLHRQPTPDAETAAAWPSRAAFARRFDDRHRRQLQRTT